MGLITVEGIRIFAYHGHLPEEAKLGGHFIVNVWVTVDTSEVEKTDDLNHTVDYVKIIEIVDKNSTSFAFPSQSLYVESLPSDKPEIFNPKKEIK